MAEMRSPEFTARVERGPVVLMTVMPNSVAPMGPIFVQWFVYLLLVSAIVGHVVAAGIPHGARRGAVFHEAALVSFAGYGLGLWQLSIWYRRSWSITAKSTVDALIYALITGAVFAWRWPA